MLDEYFMFGLKYDQIAELLEKSGFQVCDDEWNKSIKRGIDNELKPTIPCVPFMVKLGSASIPVPHGVDKEQPFKLLVANYYLQPIWCDELDESSDSNLITSDWGKILHEIYGEDYDNLFLSWYERFKQVSLTQIQMCEERGYTNSLKLHKHKAKLKKYEDIIAKYNEFLSHVSTTQNESEDFYK